MIYDKAKKEHCVVLFKAAFPCTYRFPCLELAIQRPQPEGLPFMDESNCESPQYTSAEAGLVKWRAYAVAVRGRSAPIILIGT